MSTYGGQTYQGGGGGGGTAFNGGTITSALTITITGVGTATTAGRTVQNTTDAAAGAQQYSPVDWHVGQGWKTNATAASQEVRMGWQVRPVQGAAAPSGAMHLLKQIAGGAISSVFNVDTDGVANFSSHMLLASGSQWSLNSLSTGPAIFESGGIFVISSGPSGQTTQFKFYNNLASGNANPNFSSQCNVTRAATDVLHRFNNNGTTAADVMAGVGSDGETTLKLLVHDGGAGALKLVKADTGAGGKRMLYVDD